MVCTISNKNSLFLPTKTIHNKIQTNFKPTSLAAYLIKEYRDTLTHTYAQTHTYNT